MARVVTTFPLPDEALALCRTWEDAITVERTEQLWAGGWQPPEQQSLL